MYSTFPDEWPGAGLLLLRTATGTGFVAQGIACFGLGTLISALAVLMVTVGALLLIGSLSRPASVIAGTTCVLSMFSWFPGPRVGLFETPMTASLAVVIAAALICLGPGAFSVDARLFGRREVIIPKDAVDGD